MAGRPHTGQVSPSGASSGWSTALAHVKALSCHHGRSQCARSVSGVAQSTSRALLRVVVKSGGSFLVLRILESVSKLIESSPTTFRTPRINQPAVGVSPISNELPAMPPT